MKEKAYYPNPEQQQDWVLDAEGKNDLFFGLLN